MSSSHHHLHHHHPPTATTPPPCYLSCTCCINTCTTTIPNPYPPPPLHHPPPPPQPHVFIPQNTPQQNHNHFAHQAQNQENTTALVIDSLRRRVAALETALRSPSPLRDAAARVIQTHFRSYLARRSRTLRQLQDLALIKSALNSLKSSVSRNTRLDLGVVSRKVLNLAADLDTIQGGDPMIRDGKRSISLELNRFMRLIDDLSLERRVTIRSVTKSRVSRSDQLSGNERKLLEKLKNQVEKLEGLSKVCEEEEEEKEDAELENMSTKRCNPHSSRHMIQRGNERKLLEKLKKQVENLDGLSRVYEEVEEDDEELEYSDINRRCDARDSRYRIQGFVKKHGGVQVQPKVKKNVSFSENGNVYRIIENRNEPVSGSETESIDGNDSVEEIRISSKEAKEENEEEHTDDEDEDEVENKLTDHVHEDERDPIRTARKQVNDEEEDGEFSLSAPLPVNMESITGLMNKKQQPVRK